MARSTVISWFSSDTKKRCIVTSAVNRHQSPSSFLFCFANMGTFLHLTNFKETFNQSSGTWKEHCPFKRYENQYHLGSCWHSTVTLDHDRFPYIVVLCNWFYMFLNCNFFCFKLIPKDKEKKNLKQVLVKNNFYIKKGYSMT